MLSKDKTRVVLVVEKTKAIYLASLANLFGWSKSKTGAIAMNIGMAKLAWAYNIVNKRWNDASQRDKSEAIHWLEVAGHLPPGIFENLEKEIDIEAERKKWRDAGKLELSVRKKFGKGEA